MDVSVTISQGYLTMDRSDRSLSAAISQRSLTMGISLTVSGGGIPADSILIEDGTGLLLEDGTYILLG